MKETKASRWLLLIALAVSFYNVGLIWLTQVSSYRLWPYVGPAEFEAYHGAWWRSIQPVLILAGGLAVLSPLAMPRWRPPRVPLWAVWLGIVLQATVWALTAVFWAPLQARLVQVWLPDGTLNPDFDLLLNTHWMRVALVTGYGALLFWMAARSFLSDEEDAMAVTAEAAIGASSTDE